MARPWLSERTRRKRCIGQSSQSSLALGTAAPCEGHGSPNRPSDSEDVAMRRRGLPCFRKHPQQDGRNRCCRHLGSGCPPYAGGPSGRAQDQHVRTCQVKVSTSVDPADEGGIEHIDPISSTRISPPSSDGGVGQRARRPSPHRPVMHSDAPYVGFSNLIGFWRRLQKHLRTRSWIIAAEGKGAYKGSQSRKPSRSGALVGKCTRTSLALT